MRLVFYIRKLLIAIGLLFLIGCNQFNNSTELEYVDHYLNMHDSVEYTGRWVCIECHYNNFKTYQHTGMGLSFDTANRQKSASVIGKDTILYDHYKNLYYQPFWDKDTLMLREYRIEDGEAYP